MTTARTNAIKQSLVARLIRLGAYNPAEDDELLKMIADLARAKEDVTVRLNEDNQVVIDLVTEPEVVDMYHERLKVIAENHEFAVSPPATIHITRPHQPVSQEIDMQQPNTPKTNVAEAMEEATRQRNAQTNADVTAKKNEATQRDLVMLLIGSLRSAGLAPNLANHTPEQVFELVRVSSPAVVDGKTPPHEISKLVADAITAVNNAAANARAAQPKAETVEQPKAETADKPASADDKVKAAAAAMGDAARETAAEVKEASTTTKVVVGLGATALVGVAAYAAYSFFSDNDEAPEAVAAFMDAGFRFLRA